MVQMSVNWWDALVLAGRSFGTVFLVLAILSLATWLIGLVFQRAEREKAKSATEVQETEKKN